MRRTLAVVGVALAALQLGYADASYEHTSRISGGQFIDFLKNAPMISKQMKSLTEPTSEITMVHGNQKATVSKLTTEIYDLDKQQVIHIDNEKKTYSVTTFADYRKMMQEMPARMAQMQQQMKDAQAHAQQAQGQMPPSDLQYNFTANVSDPGVTKVINGKNARQQILTLKMTVTEPSNPGMNVAYTMTTEIWTTPELPEEMREVQEFDRRFYGKLMEGQDVSGMMEQMKQMRDNRGGAMSMMFGSKPGAAEAFAQMGKELAKIKGTRILEIQRMGGSGTGMAPQGGSPGYGSGQPQPQGGSMAGQVAQDTATQTAQGEMGSHLGGSIPGAALGGALMSAWNHRKTKQAAPPPAPAATANATAAAPGSTGDITLMEMTTETHDFSQESIPPSVFDIPAGYKLVPSPMEQMLQRK